MKKTLLTLVGAVALTGVALAQNTGTTTTSTSCTGTATACSVQGQTLLQAVKVEGLTLTVPNEIDFVLVDGQMNQGNQPLTATVTWDLSTYTGTYTNIDCDAWFATADAMTPTDGVTTQTIPATAIIGQIGGNGPQVAFGSAPAYNQAALSTYAAFPIFSVPPTTNSTATGIGSFSTSVNLFVDSINNSFPVLQNPSAVYAGVVYVTAAAV